MIKVQNYIKELLFDNECVIIPNFGGFVTSYKSSEIHPIKHHFIAPSKRIAFNEKLKLNDGLLISYIANSAKISLKDASDQVQNFVSELNEKIKSKQKYSIDGIGIISKNVEGRLQFKSEIKDNFLEDSFGLPDFFSEPILRDENNIKLRNKFKDRKSMSTEGIKEEKVVEKKKGGSAVWILGVVALLLCCSAAYIFVIDKGENNALSSILPTGWFSNNNLEEQSIEVLDSTEIYEEEIIDSTFNEEEEIYEEEVNTFEEEVVEEEITTNSDEIFLTALTSRYYVITGAFSEQSNAETLRDELIAKGYDAKVLSPLGKKPLFRVSIADFEDQQSGIDKSTSENSEFGNALWVMKY